MTQNRTSTSTNLSYSHKGRGTHARVSRVRVTTVGKTPFPEKQYRSCPRCKESTNSMKLLNARVEKIEQLVDILAKTTRGLASMSKREDRFVQSTLKFKEIDLTRCTLQELQKLVIAATNIMVPPNTNNTANNNITNTRKPPSTKDTTLSDITITTNNEKKIFHTEPTTMEDIKIIPNAGFVEPESAVASFKQQPSRQDSGFSESLVEPKNVVASLKQQPSRQDSGFSESLVEPKTAVASLKQQPSRQDSGFSESLVEPKTAEDTLIKSIKPSAD